MEYNYLVGAGKFRSRLILTVNITLYNSLDGGTQVMVFILSPLRYKGLLEKHILFRNGGVLIKAEITTAACLSEYHILD